MGRGIDLFEDNSTQYQFDLDAAFNALTNATKVQIYDKYVEDTRVRFAAREFNQDPRLIRGMFVRFEWIEKAMQSLMKGTYQIGVTTSVDSEGNTVDVPEYAPIPSTITSLKTFINTAYMSYVADVGISPVFSILEVKAVVGFIISNSRKNISGAYDGDFTFYKNHFA